MRSQSRGTAAKSRYSLAAATALLALTSLAAKVLGAVYRVPLTNLLGAEGMGLYQTFFPVYALFVTLTSGAIPAVVSRYVAASDASGRDSSAVYLAARRLSLGMAAAGVALFAAAAFPVAKLQSIADQAIGYAILVPAVAAVAMSSLYRGWFLARGNASVCAILQTAEQAVKLAVGLTLVFALSRLGTRAAVFGALAAVTISEFSGWAVAKIRWNKEDIKIGACVDKQLAREMFAAMLPMLASALVMPIVTFVDSFAIVRLLGAYGLEQAAARQQYGLLTGAVGTLVNLPVVVSLSVAVAVLPKLTAEFVTGGNDAAHAKTTSTMTACLALALPCSIAFAMFAPEILSALYPTLTAQELGIAAMLLRAQAANVTLISLMQILCSALQATGKGGSVMRYMLLAGACRVVVQAALMPRIGVIAAPIAQCSMYALATALAALRYREQAGAPSIARNMVVKIALACVIMVVAEIAVTTASIPPWTKLVAAAAVGAAAYGGTLFLPKLAKRRSRTEDGNAKGQGELRS